MSERELCCPFDTKDLQELAKRWQQRCPCGWPDQPCMKEWPELRTDDPGEPPEPGCYFDGETWRSY
jgi:hypothetical protein